MERIEVFNYVIAALFFVCYSYQFFYLALPFVMSHKPHMPETKHRYAVLISARNEEKVITQLIYSIWNQTYDTSLITVFVIADNCTDHTAAFAKSAGAVVYERFNRTLVGKGYALDELLNHISGDYPDSPFDGYFVFDADNVLSPTYFEEMNRTFSDGYDIITSYRNSKNYGDNWISAGYGLWFLREAKYLNNSRMLVGSSCAVSGTGFMFSRRILQKMGGWKFFLLTEDIEFSVSNITEGERIAYCPDAVLFDEQPVKFSQSWKQRLRWAKGYLQVFHNYGAKLLHHTFKGRFSCYDMSMTIMPAIIVSILSIVVNSAAVVVEFVRGGNVGAVFSSFCVMMLWFYMTLYILGLITTITEWRSIYTSNWKKIAYTFTFPLFMMTYIPITLTALFKKVQWQPIEHTRVKDLSEIVKGDRAV